MVKTQQRVRMRRGKSIYDVVCTRIGLEDNAMRCEVIKDQKRCLMLRRALKSGEPTRVAAEDWASDVLVLLVELTPLMMSAARSARKYVGA